MKDDFAETWRLRALAFEEEDKLHGPDADCVHSILVSTEEVKQIAKALDLLNQIIANQAGS